MKKQRCKTIQIDDDSNNSDLDYIFKRAYEERLLPNLVQPSSTSSSTFQKSLQRSNRDFRMHSLSLTRPINFTKEDFIDAKERFQRIYDPFTNGKKPVDYFQNKIVDAYAFEPQIIFENCEEQQKLSPFKDLLITNQRQVVFNSKLDEAFIGHKVQEIHSPLKGGGQSISLQSSTHQLNKFKDQLKKEDFYDENNFNLTQHKQGSFKQLLPSIRSNKIQDNCSTPSSSSENLNFNLKQHINIFAKKRRLQGVSAELKQISCTTGVQSQFNPYQPDPESSNVKYTLHPKQRYDDDVQNNDESFQRVMYKQQYQYGESNELSGNCKPGSIRKIVLSNKPQQLNQETASSISLKESFQQLKRDRKDQIQEGSYHQQQQQQGQFRIYNLDAQLDRGRQFLKQNKSSSHQSNNQNSLSLKKDSKYLVDNFSSVHGSDKIRENPIHEYLLRQNELTRKKQQLQEVN